MQIEPENWVKFFNLLWGINAELGVVETEPQRLVLIHVELLELIQKFWFFHNFLGHDLGELVVKLYLLLQIFLSIFSFFLDKCWLIFGDLVTKPGKLLDVDFLVTNDVIFSCDQELFEGADQFLNWSFSDVEGHASGKEIVSDEEKQEHKVLNDLAYWVLEVCQLVLYLFILHVEVLSEDWQEDHLELDYFLLFWVLDFYFVSRVDVLLTDDTDVFHG